MQHLRRPNRSDGQQKTGRWDGKKCHYNPASAILTSGYNPRENVEYQEYENMGNDIIEALTGRRPEVN